MAALPGLFRSGLLALLPVLAVGCAPPVTVEPIGHLHLRAVLDVGDPAAAAAEHRTFDGEDLALGPDRVFPVAEATIFHMAKATSFPVPAPKGEMAIRCQIAADRSQEFEAWTAELVGRRIAWLVDGRVILAATVMSALPGGIILWGGRDEWSREDAEHFLECVRTDHCAAPACELARGVVLGPDGLPASGALVVAFPEQFLDPRLETVAGLDGAFVLRGVAGRYRLRVAHGSGLLDEDPHRDLAPRTDLGTLRIPLGGEVLFHLRGPGGEPPAGDLTASTIDPLEEWEWLFLELPECMLPQRLGPGEILFGPLPPGERAFRFWHDRDPSETVTVEILPGQRVEREVTLGLRASLSLRVLEPDGAPAAGAWVEIVAADESPFAAPTLPDALDADGGIGFERERGRGLQLGANRVFARREGGSWVELGSVEIGPGPNQAELRFPPPAELRLVVTRDGAPAAHAVASLASSWSWSWSWRDTPATETADEHGVATFRGVEPGPHGIEVACGDAFGVVRRQLVLQPGLQELHVAIPEPVAIRGGVRGAGPGHRVQILVFEDGASFDSLGGRPLSEAGWRFLCGSREAEPGIACDADGAFRFLAHPGRLGLRAQSAALDTSYPVEVVVADRPIADLVLEVVPSGVIRLGRARAAESEPWRDCRVLAVDGRPLGALIIPLRPGDEPDELRVPAGPCRVRVVATAPDRAFDRAPILAQERRFEVPAGGVLSLSWDPATGFREGG